VEGAQGGRKYGSDTLLESKIVLFLLCLIVRLSEARVSMINAKGGVAEKV